jgi:hypothetical protein
MTGNLIQLNNTNFWLMYIAAVVTMVPLTWAAPRKWGLAALKLPGERGQSLLLPEVLRSTGRP